MVMALGVTDGLAMTRRPCVMRDPAIFVTPSGLRHGRVKPHRG
jgi:hypothetical protein